jgi:hypothetical protein
MIRVWILAGAMLSTLTQDVEGWIVKLASDDVEARAQAKRNLIEAGDRVIPAIRKSLEGAKDVDLRARLREILARVARAEAAGGVKIEIVPLKDPPTVKEVNGKDFKVTLRFTNENDFEVVLWPYFEHEVFQSDGKAAVRTLKIGFGVRPEGCFLKSAQWLIIEPKKSAEISAPLSYNELEFRMMNGWKFDAGEYALVFRSSYSRENFVKRCRDKCDNHGDPEKLWNRALDLERTVKGTLTVRE